MKRFFQRSNRLYCLTNICVCLLCSTYLYTGYSEISNDVQQELTGTAVEKDLDPLSKETEIKSEIKEEKKEQAVENKIVTNNQTNKITNKNTTTTNKTTTSKTTTTKKVVTSNKKTTTSSKKYVKPKYDSVTGSAIVDYAKKYLGLRYVSGGNSLTKGTDCSGFTKLIYKEFGITLSRSVKAQVKNGIYVQKSDLQKGDLLFYGSKKGVVTHVAIYIGNGKVIHQSNPRDGVKINTMNMMVYITARRVITKPATKSPVNNNDTIKNESTSNNVITENKDSANNNVNDNTNINTNNNVNTNINTNNNVNINNINTNVNENNNVSDNVNNNTSNTANNVTSNNNQNNNVNSNITDNKVYTNNEYGK